MDYRAEYQKIEAKGFPMRETIRLSEALGQSDAIADHFELCCREMRNPESGWGIEIEQTFSDHGRAGVDYLLARLKDSDEIAGLAAYLLAHSRMQMRCPLTLEEKEALLLALTHLSESRQPEVRRRCLFAIRWMGNENELSLLLRHLLTDPDASCRALSASSLRYMSGTKRVASEILQMKTRESLIECLKSEHDVFVKGTAIQAIQMIWDISFGLRSMAVESGNQKAVRRASLKALSFLEQSDMEAR